MDLLRHVRFFVAVSDNLHFGHAADELGMAQPPLSQGIQRLERHLGVRLFDRDARRVRLTEAGSELLPAARALLADADGWVTSARSWSARTNVRFGIAEDLLDRWESVLEELSADGWDLLPVVRPSSALVHLARAGEVDVALIRHPLLTDGLLTGDVVSAPFRLEARDAPARASLPIVTPPRGNHPPAHDQLLDALTYLGHSGAVVEVGTAEERRAWVATGRATQLVPARPHDEREPVVEIRARLVTAPLSARHSAVDRAALMARAQEFLS